MHRFLANPPRPIVLALALSLAIIAGCSESPVASPPPSIVDVPAATYPVPEVREEPKPVLKPVVTPPGAAPEGMVWIPGGTFMMGTDDASLNDAGPRHEVTLDGFWVDKTEVTNRQFEAFVKATGYVTVAEQKPDPKDFPDAPPDLLVPGSIVFTPPDRKVPLDNHLVWWRYVPGANWRQPEGPDSTIKGRENHPVVHICWDDAFAYAKWAGKRLPTEAEWEYASRGKNKSSPYLWGNDFKPNGKWPANIWQGEFPSKNTEGDGFRATAPVASFPPNDYGLYDMGGNVWEWCSDWYRPNYESGSLRNPEGPPSSFDPAEPGVKKRVQRGGSYLCTDQYCTSYLPGWRGKGAADSAATHIGLRCVKSPPAPKP